MNIWLFFCGGVVILAASLLIWSLCRAAANTREVRVNYESGRVQPPADTPTTTERILERARTKRAAADNGG